MNVVNSHGNIKSLTILNSFSDAVDMDFSKIKIKSVNIDVAGNDCIDFSGGFYMIDSAALKECHDKGISVGEKSNLIAKNVFINNSSFNCFVIL